MSWRTYSEPECVDEPAPVALEIKPRPRDLGGFEVARVLPARERRMVGPSFSSTTRGRRELRRGVHLPFTSSWL